MNVRDAIEQRLRTRIVRMRTAFDQFNDVAAERERVGPNWNVRDLAGHFVFWTAEGATQIERLSRGETLPAYDLEKINADVYRRNRRMSFVMLLPQLRTADEALLAAIRKCKPDMLIGETPLRTWIDTLADHYDHHWPSLKAATDRLPG